MNIDISSSINYISICINVAYNTVFNNLIPDYISISKWGYLMYCYVIIEGDDALLCFACGHIDYGVP